MKASGAGVRGTHVSVPLDDQKLPTYTKAKADYGPAPKKAVRCDGCKFFADGKCSMVQGKIDPGATCRFFSPAAPKAAEEIRGKKLDPAGRDDEDRSEPGQKRLPKTATASEVWRKFYDVDRTMTLDDAASTRRSWMPVFPEGTYDHPEYGDLIFDATTLPEYIDNFYNKVRHIDPCVDIDHRNEEAAGWIKELEWRRGDGLYALVDWNDLGIQLIKSKQYRYASAQFGEYKDEQTGAVYKNVLSAITLTNFPFLKRMSSIQLTEADEMRSLHQYLHRAAKSTPDVALRERATQWLSDSAGTREERFTEGRAIAGQIASLEAAQGIDVKTKDKRLTLPEFIQGKGEAGMAKADDDEMAKANKADDSDADAETSELDDDAEASELDDDAEASEAATAADSGDDGDADDSPRPKAKGYAKKASEPRMTASERRLFEENRSLKARLGNVEKTLREGVVDRQAKELSDERHESGVTFGDKVLDEFKAAALKSRAAGELIYKFLSLVREDGGMFLSGEVGRGEEDDDDDHDPILLAERGGGKTRTEKGDIEVGGDIVKLAEGYAKQNSLDWDDMTDRMTAMDAVINGNAKPAGKSRVRTRQ